MPPPSSPYPSLSQDYQQYHLPTLLYSYHIRKYYGFSVGYALTIINLIGDAGTVIGFRWRGGWGGRGRWGCWFEIATGRGVGVFSGRLILILRGGMACL